MSDLLFYEILLILSSVLFLFIIYNSKRNVRYCFRAINAQDELFAEERNYAQRDAQMINIDKAFERIAIQQASFLLGNNLLGIMLDMYVHI